MQLTSEGESETWSACLRIDTMYSKVYTLAQEVSAR